jgi:NO-binding membrane sensor protein with MHYT domain
MAGKGQTSHYNMSTPFYSAMFSLMALAATLVTLYTAYVGFLFFAQSFPTLPDYYVWAIRFSIIIFVIFSFEGFAMGSRLSHTVGAINDNSNWFILGWSKTVGDLRVSHFIGMHALQLLPILSFYVFKNTKTTIIMAVLYGFLAVFTLVQALQGKSFLKVKNENVK